VHILKYAFAGFAAGVTLSVNACTVLEFGAENLLYRGQNTRRINFQELAAFVADAFPTRPIFTGSDPRFQADLNAPIDLTGYGYAVVHYAPGTTGNPAFNLGGSLDFYFISGTGACQFAFPQRFGYAVSFRTNPGRRRNSSVVRNCTQRSRRDPSIRDADPLFETPVGAFTTYSGPVHMQLDDIINAYASASGFQIHRTRFSTIRILAAAALAAARARLKIRVSTPRTMPKKLNSGQRRATISAENAARRQKPEFLSLVEGALQCRLGALANMPQVD